MGTLDQWFSLEKVFEVGCDKEVEQMDDLFTTLKLIMASQDPRRLAAEFEQKQEARRRAQRLAKSA